MPPTKPTLVDSPASSSSDLFERASVEVKGKTFTFRELSAEEYDKSVDLATKEDRLDTVQLLRWMIIKSSEDPKLTPEDVAKLPFGVVGKIGKVVNDLHFGPAPEVETGDDEAPKDS